MLMLMLMLMLLGMLNHSLTTAWLVLVAVVVAAAWAGACLTHVLAFARESKQEVEAQYMDEDGSTRGVRMAKHHHNVKVNGTDRLESAFSLRKITLSTLFTRDWSGKCSH
jgi:hypothetical protein